MFRFVEDYSAAMWLPDRLHPFCTDTGSVIPEGYDEYARVFHPLWTRTGTERREEMAKRNGRSAHSEMQLDSISRPAGAERRVSGGEPHGAPTGSLPSRERQDLVDLLRPATGTPERCWFLVWDGWGCLDHQGIETRFVLPAREYLLATGRIEDVIPSVEDPPYDQSPNIWWPADQAWCVATEVDYAWTYVGGSGALIQSILDHNRLEAWPAKLSDLPFYDSDRINAD